MYWKAPLYFCGIVWCVDRGKKTDQQAGSERACRRYLQERGLSEDRTRRRFA